MSTAVAEMDTPPDSGNPLRAGLARLSKSQKIKLALGAFGVLALAVALFFMGQQPDWKVLYNNLGDKDGGAIVSQLTTMNVPYKYAEGGGAIMVPSDKVHDTRLRLASLGLPKGTVNGFELMEANRFGMTQFQERLTFQRGLEGELTRSIQSLSSVQAARVHLALPAENGFFREQQKPSASVLLTLHAGRTLDKSQIAGIVHLVASSVPEMNPKAVSVVDDAGSLLSATPDGLAQGADIQKLQYVQQVEQLYTRRILDMIEPLVGVGNVKAQVSADIDFSLAESTSEQHRPNLATDASAIRSQQVVESTGPQGNPLPTGVPGATTNQPPAPSAAPINGANPPPTAAGQQAQGAQAVGSKRESITNYEVDKTVRVTRGGSGALKRVSAAVVVNYQSTEDKGKTVSKALTPEQLEQMTALVRETIGFNRDRGDSVNLMNTPFQVTATPTSDIPLWKQPEVIDLAKSFAWPVGAVLFAALVLMGLVRPALKGTGAAAKPRAIPVAGGQLDAVESETPERPALPAPAKKNEVLPATPEQLRLEEARVLAKENPVAVANILKTWLNGEPV